MPGWKIERLVSGWDNPAMIWKATKSIRGSGNIYRDFDVPDADVRQLKTIQAAEIIKTLDKKGLTVRKAQSLTGIDAGDFSRVRNADFRRISVERLMAMINGLGSRVEVAVTLRRAETRHAAAVA
ncbi:MAG: helix-turn-helix transcriptional regulator [Burkholderiales bacterium]|nr:helix-turn-helix transcriptional regulator [Burkholderiales bacterium]